MNSLDLVYAAGAAALAPLWITKSRGGWAERLGDVRSMLPEGFRSKPRDRPRLVLHGVSVGEVSALRSLVPLLEPWADVIIASTTDTGLARARTLYQEREPPVPTVRFPLDFSRSVRRFLDEVKPDAVALTELEVWPNFMAACARRGIPAAVINGRLSASSFAGYRRIGPIMSPAFRRLAFAAAQDETFAERFRAMGVPEGRVRVVGSLKWDAATLVDRRDQEALTPAQAIATQMGLRPGDPSAGAVVIAASTGPGEEALVHAACAEAETSGVPLQLVVAPRKPERFAEAAAAVPGAVRRSEGRAAASSRYLLDTIGELGTLYRVADVVIVGRSFPAAGRAGAGGGGARPAKGLGGSDPIEPAAAGAAVVMGPDVRNFESVVGALESAGGIVRTDAGGLGRVIRKLLSNEEHRRSIGAAGLSAVIANRGASERHATLLRDLLDERRGGDAELVSA